MKNRETFRKLLGKIQTALSKPWYKIVFVVIYPTDDKCFMKLYVKNKPHGMYSCYDSAMSSDLDELYEDINTMISEKRNMLSDDKRWSSMTFTVDNEGDMTVQLDYATYSIKEHSVMKEMFVGNLQ